MSYSVLYERGIKRLFTQQGPVGRIIDQKADLIYNNAKGVIAEKLVSRSGDLEAALRKIPRSEGGVHHVVVGSDATHRGFPYARALELGIDPFTGEQLMGGNTRAGSPGVPVGDKAFMVPAVRRSGFRLRRAA